MFSGNKLTSRREALGISQSELARRVGINRSSIFNWENGKSQPNQKNLRLIAEILGVTTEFFESEHEIVELFLQLDEKSQKKVLDFSKAQLAEKQSLFPYKVYHKLSAGTGTYVPDDYEHEYDTVFSDKKINYDIASWVAGDSMEPQYLNGSVALIKGTGFDYNGAIYAIVWDGETFIKKVYEEEDGYRLVSLNKKYPDRVAPYDQDVKIVGKVVGNFMPMEY